MRYQMDINHEGLVQGGVIVKTFAAAAYVVVMRGLYGDSLAAIQMYVTFLLLDYVTGVLAAIINGKASSRCSLAGILRKLQGVIAVSFGHFLDVYCHVPNNMAQTTFALMLCGTEVISIVENFGKSGITLPAWVGKLGIGMVSSADIDPTKPTANPTPLNTAQTIAPKDDCDNGGTA